MTRPRPAPAFIWTATAWGHALQCAPLLPIAHHLFTDASLSLGARDVQEWNAIARAAGVPTARLLLLRQVHGDTVVEARDERWDPPAADAIVSDDPSSALVVRVADCAPILMADSRTGAVAAVHAGWRSTMQRIARAAIARMHERFATNPADLVVAIGPSLGTCCGEMGEEVVEAFRAAGHDEATLARWFVRQPGRRPHFDLWRANREQLESSGVPPASIHVAGLCTRTHPDVFHSYRGRGTGAGRMAAVIRATRR